MKYLIFSSIAILTLVLVVSQNSTETVNYNNCPRVKCTTSKPSSKTGVCGSVVQDLGVDKASLMHCEDEYVCPASPLLGSELSALRNTTYSCEKADIKLDVSTQGGFTLPKEKCSANGNCASNSCVDLKCVGKKEDATCVRNAECEIGLTCINKKCTKQRKAGEACEMDSDCSNDLGCGNDMKCAKYRTLEDRTELTGTTSPLMCKSGWSRLDGLKRLCDTATLVKNQCEKDSDEYCNYTLSNGNAYRGSRCQCKYDETKSRYCPELKVGDTKVNGDSHTDRRFTTGGSWNNDINQCVQESLHGTKEWYVKAYEGVAKAFYGALEWVSNWFGSSTYMRVSLAGFAIVAALM